MRDGHVSKGAELPAGAGDGGGGERRAGAGAEPLRRPWHPILGLDVAVGAAAAGGHRPCRAAPPAAGADADGRGAHRGADGGRTGGVAAVQAAVCAAGGGGAADADDGAGQHPYLGLSGDGQRHCANGNDPAGAGKIRRGAGGAEPHPAGGAAQPCAAGAAGRGVADGEYAGLHRPCAGGGAPAPAPSLHRRGDHQRGGRSGRPCHQRTGAGRGGAGHGGQHRHGGAGADLRRGGLRPAGLPAAPRYGAGVGADVV